jgi:hypothetical protein
MQEKFLLRTKTAIKRVAALGTGVAMLGATVTGALAQDLGAYPAPFVNDGKYDNSNALVVGANAAASDTLGAVDIASNLQFESKECSPSAGTVSVSGGVSEDIPLGENIVAVNQIDPELDDADLDGLLDTQINFQSSDYDVSEIIEINQGSNASMQTSLTASDDDYEENVVMEIEKDALKYYYKFDETIQLNSTTSADPLEINILGHKIKITSIDSATKFTAQVGTEFFMDIDDVVTVLGKKVTLKNVGSGGAVVVDVEGVQDTLSSGVTRTVNGLEITNDETFYTDDRSERSATLVIGKDATTAYTDADEFIGEDENDPAWVWDLANLHTKGTTTITNSIIANVGAALNTTGPTIGVENDWRYVDGSDSDPLFPGDCLDYPNNYVSVCFDSLSVSDDDYIDVTMEFESRVDFSDTFAGMTATDAVRITSSKKDTFLLKDAILAADNLTKNTKTDEVWIAKHDILRSLMVFYRENENNKIFYAGNLSIENETRWLEIDYGDTKDTNVVLDFNWLVPKVTGDFNLTWNVVGDTGSDLRSGIDDIHTLWSNNTAAVTSLGATKSSEEANEVYLATAAQVFTNLGTKDENHRTRYGIILYDPKSNGASDEVRLSIPKDQVQANVVIRGPATTGATSGGQVCSVADITPRTMLHNEVSNPSDFNLILVGGPCANPLVEDLGFGVTCSGWELSQGEALVKLVNNGNKVAMLVAGTNSLDTRRAAKVVANSADYSLSGSEAMVKGTTLTDITVE